MKMSKDKKVKLMLGDNMISLKKLPDNSVDSVVTDVPYGLGKEQDMNVVLKDWLEKGYSEIKGTGFMGKEWDAYVPQPNLWKEVYRVLKPGGHVLSFFGTRTYDVGVMAMRLAGFEIRDCVQWIYGQGFPKSHNIGKAVKKIDEDNNDWNSFGTALKPANEPICLARKPLSEKTIAKNVLKHGTGGINIDGCRVEYTSDADKESAKPGSLNATGDNSMFGLKSGNKQNEQGRFPANIILDEDAGKILDEQSGESVSKKRKNISTRKDGSLLFDGIGKSISGDGEYNDKGGASRFFYCPKVSKKERNLGLDEGEKSTHPTVKPVALMRYLCRLITPPNGIVLDMYMGSGATGIAARLEGFRFCGMELDEEYMKIAEARIKEYKKYESK